MLQIISQIGDFLKTFPIKFYSKALETIPYLLGINGLFSLPDEDYFSIVIKLRLYLLFYQNLIAIRRRKTEKLFFQKQENTCVKISYR
jgi:hypothetical protein